MTGGEILALAATAAAGRWGWHAYFHPFGPCKQCEGRKTNPGSTRRRFGQCRSCKGSGSRQVRGSKQVHKLVRSVMAARGKKG